MYDLGTVKTLRYLKSSERDAITVPAMFLLGRPSPSSKGKVSNIPYTSNKNKGKMTDAH